jgi:hypothetical protein
MSHKFAISVMIAASLNFVFCLKSLDRSEDDRSRSVGSEDEIQDAVEDQDIVSKRAGDWRVAY